MFWWFMPTYTNQTMIKINGLYQPTYDRFYTNIYQAFMVLPWGKLGKPGCPSPFAPFAGRPLVVTSTKTTSAWRSPSDFHRDLPKLVMTVT